MDLQKDRITAQQKERYKEQQANRGKRLIIELIASKKVEKAHRYH